MIASRRTALGAPGASIVRDRVRELSKRLPRSFWLGSAGGSGGRPLSSLTSGAAGGLGRPQPTRDGSGRGCRGLEVGEGVAHWACGQSNPAGTAWASGVSRGFWWSPREAASALKQTCTSTPPSSPFPWPQKRPPLTVLPPARCGTLRQLFAAGRASQQELCCAGVACRGVCRVSLKKTIYGVPQRSLSAHSLF